MHQHHVLGICGSLRAGSHNAALLRSAVLHAPDTMLLRAYPGLRGLPPYDADEDAPGMRSVAVAELRTLVEEADGVLIVTPEYQASIPGVLKNALDWLVTATPGEQVPLAGKPVAVIGASPGAFGAVRAVHAVQGVLHATDSDVVTKPELAVFRCHERFDADGLLVDASTAEILRETLAALAERIDRRNHRSELLAVSAGGYTTERKAER